MVFLKTEEVLALNGGTFHHSNIIEIFGDGFFYYGYNEQKCYINFRECRTNWVNYVNDSPDFKETELQDTDTKIVGWRNSSELYVEFFSEPRTRFVFTYRRNFWQWLLGKPSTKGIRAYIELAETLVKLGWKMDDRAADKKDFSFKLL
jgi:hypothetical protein